MSTCGDMDFGSSSMHRKATATSKEPEKKKQKRNLRL